MLSNYENTYLPFSHYAGDHYNQDCFHLTGLLASQVPPMAQVVLNQSGTMYSADMPSEP
jgi:hypothetical protein